MQVLESDRTGKIIRQSGGYGAFIPDSIYPDGPKINVDFEMMTLCCEAERALGELVGITETLPEPDLFVGFYVRKEALLSSQIEGTQCTMEDVVEVDEETQTFRPVGEVVNYIRAMNYGIKTLKDLPMSLRLINQIHAKLLEGVRGEEREPGEYKRSQNWIGPEGCTLKEAEYVPPPPHLMLSLMGDLEKFYHVSSKIPSLIKVATLHSHFETIHPYVDGNGRLGRLLITFMLYEMNILNRPLLYLSLFFKENRQKYYEHLMNVRFRGDWEGWIKFFLRGVRKTSSEASATARDIIDLQNRHREIIHKHLRGHKIAASLYDYICFKPIINRKDVKNRFGVSYPNTTSVLKSFCKVGILSEDTSRVRNRHFRYSEYLDILKRGT